MADADARWHIASAVVVAWQRIAAVVIASRSTAAETAVVAQHHAAAENVAVALSVAEIAWDIDAESVAMAPSVAVAIVRTAGNSVESAQLAVEVA